MRDGMGEQVRYGGLVGVTGDQRQRGWSELA